MSLRRAVSELRSGPVLACCSELQKRLLRTSAASQARNPVMHWYRNAVKTMPDAHYANHGCLSVSGQVALPIRTGVVGYPTRMLTEHSLHVHTICVFFMA
jgi:hypothetical protein